MMKKEGNAILYSCRHKIENAGDGIKALNKLRAYKEVDYNDAMESKNARLVLTQS